MFVPQRPYLPLGKLRTAIAYPAEAASFDDTALQRVLARVGLEHLAAALDTERRWDNELTLDEQQRLPSPVFCCTRRRELSSMMPWRLWTRSIGVSCCRSSNVSLPARLWSASAAVQLTTAFTIARRGSAASPATLGSGPSLTPAMSRRIHQEFGPITLIAPHQQPRSRQ